jgi:uncharacterized protein (TIGR03067 family)
MKRATWFATMLAVVAGLGAVSGLRAEDAKIDGDLKKMQGTWVRAGDDGPDSKWVIEGDSLKATVNGVDYSCKLTLDAKANPHSTADLAVKEGPPDTAGKTSKGIYKFDGDKLVLCVSMPGAENRPTEFKTVEDEFYLFELKKEK